jgi:copper chaperone CopZ
MGEQTVSLQIEGMTCDGCAQTIKRYLKQDKGVMDARIDWRSGEAEVAFDREGTDEERILGNRVFQRQYKARLAGPGDC